MFAVEVSVLLALPTLLAASTLGWALRIALPQVAGIRQALDACPETLELRFTVHDVIVRYNDGKVVPLRPRNSVSRSHPLPVSAAA